MLYRHVLVEPEGSKVRAHVPGMAPFPKWLGTWFAEAAAAVCVCVCVCVGADTGRGLGEAVDV